MLSFNFNFSFWKCSIIQVRKNKVKVSYVLSGELSGKILSHFVFSSRNLKVSIFPLEISRLINFIFSRKKIKDSECWEMIADVSFGKTSLDFIF